ncbi:hypothetical protein ALC53_03723 [Atta colombica]|uniref:Uncharacterized protein n=1 Tax=Atta colombica TaxID=520822 RepID=A0A195BNM9_9HYME|nr:hypothetical protein ALC53_03723 [Atta colombica]
MILYYHAKKVKSMTQLANTCGLGGGAVIGIPQGSVCTEEPLASPKFTSNLYFSIIYLNYQKYIVDMKKKVIAMHIPMCIQCLQIPNTKGCTLSDNNNY